MVAVPLHDRLYDTMQEAQGEIARHNHSAPYGRTGTLKGDLELVHRAVRRGLRDTYKTCRFLRSAMRVRCGKVHGVSHGHGQFHINVGQRCQRACILQPIIASCYGGDQLV